MQWDRWLRLLGQLFPTHIRDRVFEPACTDLAFEHLRDRRSTRWLGLRIFAIMVYVATVNFPRVLFEKRRPSRLGLLIGVVALASVAILVGIRIAFCDVYAIS